MSIAPESQIQFIFIVVLHNFIAQSDKASHSYHEVLHQMDHVSGQFNQSAYL